VLKRRLEYILVAFLLLIGFAVRIHMLYELSPGFSAEEITNIRIVEGIQDEAALRVFWVTDSGGKETLFHLLQVMSTTLVGDGLFGFRVLSVFANVLALALVYAVSRRLFGSAVALIALFTMSLGIWPVLVSRAVTPAALMNLFVLLVIWFVTLSFYIGHKVYPYRPHTVPYTLLAISLTLAGYTHYTGILASVAVMLFVLYLYYSQQPVSRLAWWNSGYALNLAFILGLPYLISVLREPSTAGLYVLWEDRPTSPLNLLESLLNTIIAFFVRGDNDPTRNVPGIPLLGTPEGGVMMTVGLVTSILRWREARYGLLLLFFVLGLLPDIWLRGGPDNDALVFASPIAYILISVGVVETFRIFRDNTELPKQLQGLKQLTAFLGVWPKPLIRIGVVLLLLIGLRYVWLLQQRLFVDWPERTDTQIAYQTNLANTARYIDTHDDPTLPILVCTDRVTRQDVMDFSEPVADEQILDWMMQRDAPGYRVANCALEFVLVNGGGPMQVIFTDPTSFSTMPAELKTWLNEDVATLLDDPLLDDELLFRVDAQQRLADLGGTLQRQNIMFYPREPGQEDNQLAPHPARFGGNVTFLGYMPFDTREGLNPGDILPIVTYWRVDGPLLPNTGLFLRLHDSPQASPYTEVNQFAVNARRLQPRDVVVHLVYLTLPDTLRPQEYLLTTGVYDFNPTNQLPVYDATAGNPRGTYLLIDEPFTVTAP
jgi:hypothetical protein